MGVQVEATPSCRPILVRQQMPGSYDKDWFGKRHESYLATNYLALHNTVVSVALAVAGLAAGNLIRVPAEYITYQPILWALWVVSLIATLVAFAGTAIGSGILPPMVPSLLDLAAPLLLGVSECVMFGVLGRQASGVTSPGSVLGAWYFSLAGFGVSAAFAVLRARWILSNMSYAPDIKKGVREYIIGLSGDAVAALVLFLLGIAGGVSYYWVALHPYIDYGLIPLVLFMLAMGARSHARARRGLNAILVD